MRGMLAAAVAAGVVLAAGCTPRDNQDPHLEVRDAPDAAVHREPNVTGGAYDSVIFRVARERGDTMPVGGHGGQTDHGSPEERQVSPGH